LIKKYVASLSELYTGIVLIVGFVAASVDYLKYILPNTYVLHRIKQR